MRAAALIVGAGKGERAGGQLPKQYQRVGGKNALRWSVEAFAAAGAAPIVAVIDPEHRPYFEASGLAPLVRVVAGGATRTASVRAGLDALAAVQPDIVLIHDAARPGLTPQMTVRLIDAVAAGAHGAAPALPVADSLRRANAQGRVTDEADRNGLMAVQTPQAFRFPDIVAAYHALPADLAPSDDLAVARLHGLDLVLVRGDPALMKFTYPEDLAMLERILGDADTIVGSGFDAHRFGVGDHVMLCGVRIAHGRGLIGHSDADAGWHALVDAILGALGAGDIGVHFPPSDPRWKDANSEVFLRHAATLAQQAGARIVHVDVTLICERPKVGPHREAMRARTAEALGLAIERVSIKATTTEGLGFLGREEGLAAQATATLSRKL